MNKALFDKKGRLQDAYSFRCVCQIHGIVLETLQNAQKIMNEELNSVSTRPLVYPTKEQNEIGKEDFQGKFYYINKKNQQ